MPKSNAPSFKGKTEPVEVKGTQTKAKVYTNNFDWKTYNQIRLICSHPVLKDVPVRIMPDTHAGADSVVGFSAPVGETGKVIPGLISGDIGCGMLCVNIDTKGEDIDFDKLDHVIREHVSSSRGKTPDCLNIHSKKIEKDVKGLCKDKYKISYDKTVSTLGTLGGGNHFIEIDKDDDGELYLVVHTGSRHFGKEVYDYHQGVALEQNPYSMKEWSYLSGDEAKDYLEDMRIAVKYSQVNRRIIADEIMKQMGWSEKDSFESVHNYISKDGIIRKGAISAKKGKRMIIPLNMRDGAIIAIGKGNKEWNETAPHGAGRKLSRSAASDELSLDEYKSTMKGIYSTCIKQSTIDESPMAYKNSDEIAEEIEDTAEIEKRIKPVYNFKD